MEPTGRPAKSTTSIIEKLRRESVRLTQIQDIAGCRLIVKSLGSQNDVVVRLKRLFEKSVIVDRRQKPSHGYRAVHVIVTLNGKLIEIQVRTSLQHAWAELSEKLSDAMGSAIKYGGGDAEIVSHLAAISDATLEMEIAIKANEGHAAGLDAKNFKRLETGLEQWVESWTGLAKRFPRGLKSGGGTKNDLLN